MIDPYHRVVSYNTTSFSLPSRPTAWGDIHFSTNAETILKVELKQMFGSRHKGDGASCDSEYAIIPLPPASVHHLLLPLSLFGSSHLLPADLRLGP